MEALRKYYKIIKKHEVKKVRIIGTSALRDVRNSEQLVHLIKNKFNFKLEIIDGIKEAELTYRGVNIDLPFEKFMIIDIGGGSTEFIWKLEEINFESLNLGAVRMTERYIENPEQRISENEYKKIKENTKNIIDKNFQKKYLNLPLIGVGGTITTAGAINLEMEKYNPDQLHHYVLKYDDIKNILSQILKSDIQERKNIIGLQPQRADIIGAGLIILVTTMEFLEKESIKISENDILWGMIEEIYN